jgi:hypothetical protein
MKTASTSFFDSGSWQSYSMSMPVGVIIFGARRMNGYIHVDYMYYEMPYYAPDGSPNRTHQQVRFHVFKSGDTIPDSVPWAMPVKINDIEYLTYAFQ